MIELVLIDFLMRYRRLTGLLIRYASKVVAKVGSKSEVKSKS